MTTYGFGISQMGSGVQADLAVGYDGAYVAKNVVVTSTDDVAIRGSATHHVVTIAGVVTGRGYGITLGSDSASSVGNRIDIRADAEVFGYLYYGALVVGVKSRVVNDGYIYGDSGGLQIIGDGLNSTSTVKNSGTIEGAYYGVLRSGSEAFSLTNSGHIVGEAYSLFADDADGVVKIVNTGTMEGILQLGNADDFYDGRLGHVDRIILGGDGIDTIYGGTEDNEINGGLKADIMTGGAGNDSYYVDDIADQVIESSAAAGGTNDQVYAALNYTLAKGVGVETLFSSAPFLSDSPILIGNELKQTITGHLGSDTLGDGGGGGDLLVGLQGNDTYLVGSSKTKIAESADTASGTADKVITSTNYTLGANVGIETMVTSKPSSTSAIALTGNDLKQSLTGNAGANVIDSKGGADTMTGLGGADQFVFSTALNLGVDKITDFTHPSDIIALDDDIFTKVGAVGALASTAFFAGAAAQDTSDRIIYNPENGKLYYDADGNKSGGVAAVQFAQLTDHISGFNYSDFVVIA